MQKTRPCVVVSPDELNRPLRTALVAPLTRTRRSFASRVDCIFQGVEGQVALDQLRVVDRERLVRTLGTLDTAVMQAVLQRLQEMFQP